MGGRGGGWDSFWLWEEGVGIGTGCGGGVCDRFWFWGVGGRG